MLTKNLYNASTNIEFLEATLLKIFQNSKHAKWSEKKIRNANRLKHFIFTKPHTLRLLKYFEYKILPKALFLKWMFCFPGAACKDFRKHFKVALVVFQKNSFMLIKLKFELQYFFSNWIRINVVIFSKS